MSTDAAFANRWKFWKDGGSVIVEAESFFDARAKASTWLGASQDGLEWDRTGKQPDVSLRWVGQDFSKGDPRRMEIMLRGGGWEPS